MRKRREKISRSEEKVRMTRTRKKEIKIRRE